jgi:hypothetical protein
MKHSLSKKNYGKLIKIYSLDLTYEKVGSLETKMLRVLDICNALVKGRVSESNRVKGKRKK